jgi:molybdate transport system substrate-binding protein
MARANPAPAVPLKLLTTNAVRGSLEELLPAFERQAKRKVEAYYYSTNQMLDLIKGGEAADVVILTGPALDELAKQGSVVQGSRTDLASTGIGVCVRRGAPRPDISTLDAFKRTLLDAKSIAHTTTGQSGVYFSGLIERLGIGAQVRAKARTQPGGIVGETVARGDAEIGIQQISEIYAASGADLVGPFPAEIQKFTVFSAGLFAGTRQEEAAKSLIQFLKTPASARVMKAKGLEPVKK